MVIVDTHILQFFETKRYEYLQLHQFILDSSFKIEVIKKYKQPFYGFNVSQFYIHQEKFFYNQSDLKELMIKSIKLKQHDIC